MSLLPWESVLPTYCDSGYEIRPLLTFAALAEESEKLGGCIASVKTTASVCAAGVARVFTILDALTGERVALASITLGDHVMPWKLQWMRGPGQQPLLPRIVGVANGIASLYTQNDKTQGTLWTLPPL
jgi:alkanesulfonate monooxygenase SsuD/methylene tetrahydromethanopterin reductase-like flavin-dependent oxidoreductase (luciferase family)